MTSEQQAGMQRGPEGRFLTGNKGGGRPKGARNRLTSAFLDLVVDDFVCHGRDALTALRTSDPAAYIKIIASIVPRELIMSNELNDGLDYADLTVDEISTLLDAQVRRKRVADAVDTINNASWGLQERQVPQPKLLE